MTRRRGLGGTHVACVYLVIAGRCRAVTRRIHPARYKDKLPGRGQGPGKDRARQTGSRQKTGPPNAEPCQTPDTGKRRGPRMYEMQGPRLAVSGIPADCPGEPARRGNRRATPCPSYHRSRTPAGSLVTQSPSPPGTTPWFLRVAPEVLRVLLLAQSCLRAREHSEGSLSFLQGSRSFPQDSRICLRVVPVFAGREVLQPLTAAAQGGPATIFKIL